LTDAGRERPERKRRGAERGVSAKEQGKGKTKMPKKGTGAPPKYSRIDLEEIDEEELLRAKAMERLLPGWDVKPEEGFGRRREEERSRASEAFQRQEAVEMSAALGRLAAAEDWAAVNVCLWESCGPMAKEARRQWLLDLVERIGAAARDPGENEEEKARGLAQWALRAKNLGSTRSTWEGMGEDAEERGDEAILRGVRVAFEAFQVVASKEVFVAEAWSEVGESWAKQLCRHYVAPENAKKIAKIVREIGAEDAWIEQLARWLKNDRDSAPILRELGRLSAEEEKSDQERFFQLQSFGNEHEVEELLRRIPVWKKKTARETLMGLLQNLDATERTATLYVDARIAWLDRIEAIRPDWLRPKDAAALFAGWCWHCLSLRGDEDKEAEEEIMEQLRRLDRELASRCAAPVPWETKVMAEGSVWARPSATRKSGEVATWDFGFAENRLSLSQIVWLSESPAFEALAREKGVELSFAQALELRALLRAAQPSEEEAAGAVVDAIEAVCARMEAKAIRHAAGIGEGGAAQTPSGEATRSRSRI
jgi:hypothetical protein